MAISEFCHRNVVCATRETTVTEAANLMRQHHIGDVIIVEGTRAKDGGTHGNARSVYMASTGKKLGAGSSEGVTP